MGASTSCVYRKPKSFKDVQTVHILRRKPSRHSLSSSISSTTLKFFRSLSVSKNSRYQINNSLSKEKTGDNLLSEYEMNLIRKSWSPIDRETFGVNVYRRVFDCQPELKMFFSWQDLETEDLLNNEKFRHQALAIINVIDNCVKTLENVQATSEFLYQLGKYHTKLRGYGFKQEHWVIFKLSVLLSLAFSIQGDGNQQPCLEAWDTLITFIIENMKNGFNGTLKSYYETQHISCHFT